VVTINGTCAQQLLLIALGIAPGDLVLCPAVSFVASANAIVHAGGAPLFVDVEPRHLTIDPLLVARFLAEECDGHGPSLRHRPSGRRVFAVLAVDVFGHPADYAGLLPTAARHGLAVIEDAAEALGSAWRGRPCGSLGAAAILSFNGNKLVTAGGGGAVLTDDPALAARVAHLASTAKLPHDWAFEHDEVGYNFRMPSLNAALCLGQLATLDHKLALKRALQARYRDALAPWPELALLDQDDGSDSNFWLCALRWPDGVSRDAFLDACRARDNRARACWRALPLYRAAPQAATGVARARDLAGRIANLPSSPQLLAGSAG
jgi:perosamine synthetase